MSTRKVLAPVPLVAAKPTRVAQGLFAQTTMELILLIILTLGLTATDYLATGHNSESPYNGLGCVNSVMMRKALLPMQHRVAIPWIVWQFEHRVIAYNIIKLIGNVAGVVAMYAMASMIVPASAFEASLLLIALIAGTLLFDYPDYGWEIAFVCTSYMLCIAGHPFAAAALVAPWSLLRESSVFGAVIAGMYAPIAGVAGLILWFVTRRWLRKVWGNPKHYVRGITGGSLFLWRLNWGYWKAEIAGDHGLYWAVVAFLSVAWSGWAGGTLLAHQMQPLQFAVPAAVMLGAAIAFGRWNELRTFLSAMPCVLMVWYA